MLVTVVGMAMTAFEETMVFVVDHLPLKESGCADISDWIGREDVTLRWLVQSGAYPHELINDSRSAKIKLAMEIIMKSTTPRLYTHCWFMMVLVNCCHLRDGE